MEKLVRVADLKTWRNGFTCFLDLPDLLPVLEPEARSWTWSIQREMELSVGADWDADMSDLVGQIGRDHHGLLLDFDGLVRFGHRVGQVIWGEFLAAESPDALPLATDSDEQVGARALAGLSAFDSSYWLVGGPAPMIDRVVAGFERVEHLDPRHWRRGD
jgi:hypothetical protein